MFCPSGVGKSTLEQKQKTIKQHADDLRRALTKLKISVETKRSTVEAGILTEIDYEFDKLCACIIELEQGPIGGQMYPGRSIMD